MSNLLPNTSAIPLEVLRARRAAAEVVHQFASGRLTNREFEDRFYKAADCGDRFDDPVLDEMEKILWCSYDDFKTHTLREGKHDIGPKGRRLVARWVMFLHSDCESACGPVRDRSVASMNHSTTPGWRASALFVAVACGFALWIAALLGLWGAAGRWGALLGGGAIYATGWLRAYFPLVDEPSPEVADEEVSVWPFKSREDFRNALAQPRMLAGVNRSGVLHAY